MFSVVIPVFNHAPFLTHAVESAVRDPLVAEVLVVDDGSCDGSDGVIQRLSALYSDCVRDIGDRKGTNRGAHERLNELVAAAKCEWIAVLNSDDAFVPSRFTTVLRAMRDRTVEFVSGWILVMNAYGRVFGRKRGWLDPEYPFPEPLRLEEDVEHSGGWEDVDAERFIAKLLNQNFIATTSNMVFTRSLWERVGGFRDYRYCHDWDFAIRAATNARVAWCRQYLTKYRSHHTNTISESPESVRSEVQAMFCRLQEDGCVKAATSLWQTAVAENRYLRAG